MAAVCSLAYVAIHPHWQATYIPHLFGLLGFMSYIAFHGTASSDYRSAASHKLPSTLQGCAMSAVWGSPGAAAGWS